MPYIDQHRRVDLDSGEVPETPGELNYLVTTIVLDYLGAVPSYTLYNDALGVLESVKQELYRREVAPYEDEKVFENGDVYT